MNKFIRTSLSYFKWLMPRKLVTQATFDAKPFKLYLLDDGPESSMTLTKDEAKEMFSQLTSIRRLEHAADTLYKEKVIRGFCHLYNGQEACAVGIKKAMRPQDTVITSYRAHGWCLLMGLSPVDILAELTGRIKGCSRGKGGSMHMYAKNFYGGNGIVGAQVPLGAGIALASKYNGNDAVSFTLYGDGAANQGQVFEAFNMACLWNLPVIFACENNQYGMGTADKRSSCNIEYYRRGDKIPGIWVDAMDVASVVNAAKFAISYALSCGPILLELHTYRYVGHSMSDPGTSYRSREEVQETRKTRDPLTNFKSQAIQLGILTEDDVKEIETKIKDEIAKAIEIAKNDKEVGMEELASDVYALNLETKIRNVFERNIDHKKINVGINESSKSSGTASAAASQTGKTDENIKTAQLLAKQEEKKNDDTTVK